MPPGALPASQRGAVKRGEEDAGVTVPQLVLPALDSAAKRSVDLIVSSLLLILLLPAILITVIVIRLESRGPAFFRSPRVGYRGQPLQMRKFRKMHDGARGLPLTTGDDTRFTRVGALLARTKLDEIPQLWHVLRGEMSLVGPRPESSAFVDRHAEEYTRILTVRPGITGFSQIAFAEENRILDPSDPVAHYLERLLPQKIGLDQMYASQRTLLLDLRILFWTAAAVIMRRPVAVHRASGKMKLRLR